MTFSFTKLKSKGMGYAAFWLSIIFISLQVNTLKAQNVDLELSLVAQNPDVQVFESTAFTLTVFNNSNVSATNVQIALPIISGQAVLVGGSQVQLSSGTYNPYFGQIWELPSVGAGQNETLNIELFFLSEPSVFAQVIAADQADVDSTPANGSCCTANEDDEAVFPGDSTNPQLPNLQLSNLVVFGPGTPGSVVNYQIDILNTGDEVVSGDYVIGAYLSTDDQLSNDDILVGSINTGNTPIGTTPSVPGAITVPDFVTPGNYQLLLNADDDNLIVESNENDNDIAEPLTIEAEGCNCPTVYDPVCGSDGNTYSNTCEAECAGIFSYTPGECGTMGGECSFFVSHALLGQGDPSFNQSSIAVNEDANGFNIQYGTGTPAALNFALDQSGNLLNSNVNSTSIPSYSVSYLDNSNELELQATQGSTVLWTVNIPVDYNNPTAVVPGSVYRTSNNLFFGGFIVDTSNGTTFAAFAVQTDLNGQNPVFTLIPALNDTFSFVDVTEGNNGNFYFRWFVSGNISISKVSSTGVVGWVRQVGADTPSINWNELEISQDDQFVYAVLRDNLQAIIKKINNTSGEIVNTINLGQLLSPDVNFTSNFDNGILPLANGGLLACSYYRENTSNGFEEGLEYGLLDASESLVWSHRIVGEMTRFSPEAATLDGGYLFTSRDAVPGVDVEILKVTSTGALTPECDGGPSPDGVDLEVSLSSQATSYSIYTNVIVSTTIVNTGNETANNIIVSVSQPQGTASSGFTTTRGFFNLYFAEWIVGSLAPGESATFDWNLFMLNNTSFTTYAQVMSANPDDVDSTPGNGACCIANEDDEAVLTINANFTGDDPQIVSLGNQELPAARVSPNPANEVLRLQYQSISDLIKVNIWDSQGRLLESHQLKQDEINHSFNIQDLMPGVYYLDILDGDQRQQLRFVKI